MIKLRLERNEIKMKMKMKDPKVIFKVYKPNKHLVNTMIKMKKKTLKIQ